ncbi:Arginine--tRNA ligase, partial [Bienertia sinuspersici]
MPANLIKCKCFHGGKLGDVKDDVVYNGGTCVVGTLDICKFSFAKAKKLIEGLGCCHSNVEILYMHRGKGLQILCDKETMEELRIEGATHGVVELYLYHMFDDGENGEELYPTNELYWSEPENVTEDGEAGKWVTKRNNSGKDKIKEEKKLQQDSTVDPDVLTGESEHKEKHTRVKDNYWGEDNNDYMEYFEHDRDFCEVDSDNENPLIQSDEEDCSDFKKGDWPMYDPNTPFGSVRFELGQLFENVEVCQTHTTWNYYHNEPHWLLVKCKFYGSECRWKLSARHMKEHGCLQVRFLKDIHTCTPTMKNKRVNSNFLAEEYQEKLLKHPTWKLKLFIKDVEDTYGVRIDRWQAARAKKFSLSACAKGAPLHKLFWRAIKAYTEQDFEDAMKELNRKSSKAYEEMCARNVKKFCRCFYKPWASTDVTCNNMAETLNSWIIEAREKPILTMLEDIRRQIMSRMVDKKAQASKCIGVVTPRIRAWLNDFRQTTKNWRPIEAST